MHSCSVAVLFQQVQYRVQDVSWPNMPYSQSQCSRAIGPSVKRNTNGYNNIDWQLPRYHNFKTYDHIQTCKSHGYPSKGPHPVNQKLCTNVQTTSSQTQHFKPKMSTITVIQLYNNLEHHWKSVKSTFVCKCNTGSSVIQISSYSCINNNKISFDELKFI